jgi:transposase
VFIKKAWSTYKGKRSVQYHVAESYRDPETGNPKHHLIANVTALPQHAIESLRQSLRTGQAVSSSDVEVRTGDGLRGAGILAAYRAWRQKDMDSVLGDMTSAQKQSALAMVLQRIFDPGSKLSLKRRFRNTILSKLLSEKRLDEDVLYEVMDELHKRFYEIQERLAGKRESCATLCLYDITSTYFEGTEAEEGEYGLSRDKRWDRYQIVIGLVCDEKGLPVAIEVWPGNTADRTTVANRVKALREQFGIESAVFVGDGGMYSQANIEQIEEHGLDYILHVDWHTQRKQLESLTPVQMELLDERGVVEWIEGDNRYIGCVSEHKRARAAKRREKGMLKAEQDLAQLAETAKNGSYYSWTRCREKVNQILRYRGVSGLWQVSIEPLEQGTDPETKTRLELSFAADEESIARKQMSEGKYVLRTSLSPESTTAEQVDYYYHELQKAERAFRHIKSFLKIRPVYHWLKRRIRAHVLICFLAYYLVKWMEIELREKGIGREIELLLREWDQLLLVQQHVIVGEHETKEWQWSLGEIGLEIQKEIKQLGWWHSLEAHRRSLVSKTN